MLKASWESEERKSVEREIRSGVEQFNKQINKALEQTRVEQQFKKVQQSVTDVWETAHGPQVLHEMHLGLVDSLRRFNDELAKHAEPRPAHEVTPEQPVTRPVDEVKP